MTGSCYRVYRASRAEVVTVCRILAVQSDHGLMLCCTLVTLANVAIVAHGAVPSSATTPIVAVGLSSVAARFDIVPTVTLSIADAIACFLQAIPGGPKPAPGVNVILDLVGASHFSGNLESLTVEGKLLLVGLPSGSTAEINLALVRLLVSTILASRC